MAEDGRFFVTSVALQNTSLWLHDTSGEREISLEGNAAEPRFTSDGGKRFVPDRKGASELKRILRDPGEVRVANSEIRTLRAPGARL